MMHFHNKTKRLTALLVASALATTVFAQAADDGFVVPLDQDFTKVVASSEPAVGGGTDSSNSGGSAGSLGYGLWVQTQSVNEAIIRNVRDGTKSGYEFDNAHFLTEANWWFWGKVSKNVQVASEIGVLNFDRTLYKANSYGANVPDVTWGDGFQSIIEMFSSPFKKGNDEGLGMFNKMGVDLTTPYLVARFGYGDLDEKNGMSHFDGIFNVIDFKDYNGYTELKNGSAWQRFGDITLNVLAAFSDKVGTYGTYDYIDVTYADKAQAVLTFGSSSTEEQLFYYNKTNTNAFSAYVAATPIAHLKAEAHLLGTFGTDDLTLGKDTLAGAGRVTWTADTWSASLMQSVAGKKVNSVWGSDGEYYDDINADRATTQIDLAKSLTVAQKLPLALGLDQGISYTLADDNANSRNKGLLTFRTEPFADIALNALLGKNITAGVYGVLNTTRLDKNTDPDQSLAVTFEEAGIEFTFTDTIPHVQKLVLDYAVFHSYDDWNGSKYPLLVQYHSIMANADITDRLNVTFGSVVRADKTHNDANVPFGFAFGASYKRVPLPGKPMVWAHFSYGMWPYGDNNYSLYRKDEEEDKSTHRTYLLDDLSGYSTISRISLGLIWDL